MWISKKKKEGEFDDFFWSLVLHIFKEISGSKVPDDFQTLQVVGNLHIIFLPLLQKFLFVIINIDKPHDVMC